MRFRSPDLDALVRSIATDPRGMPVRAMEAVLDRGAPAVDSVIDALRSALPLGPGPDGGEPVAASGGEAGPEPDPLWLLVLLGELRDPRAVPVLVEVLRALDSDEYILASVAAESLAKLGPPALEGVHRLLETGTTEQRLWAYAIAGWIDDDAAYELLVAALETDRELAEVVGNALADQGRKDAIPHLLAALPRVEPWQRVELEDAIVALHGEAREPPMHETDWRLRYRVRPSLGAMAPAWPVVSLVLREDDTVRRMRQSRAVLSLDEILARPTEPGEEPERCDCCDVPVFYATGAPVCPETAVSVAAAQHTLLGELRDELDTDDLFDVLDVAEEESLWIRHDAGEPRTDEEHDELEYELVPWEVLIAACRWLLERGTESVAAGRATLLAEMARLAELHGDPDSVLSSVPAGRSGTAATPGRNDPCPCGSGRKYKKCCGRPGAEPSERPLD